MIAHKFEEMNKAVTGIFEKAKQERHALQSGLEERVKRLQATFERATAQRDAVSKDLQRTVGEAYTAMRGAVQSNIEKIKAGIREDLEDARRFSEELKAMNVEGLMSLNGTVQQVSQKVSSHQHVLKQMASREDVETLRAMVKAEIQSRVTGQVDVIENLGSRISDVEADVSKACFPLMLFPFFVQLPAARMLALTCSMFCWYAQLFVFISPTFHFLHSGHGDRREEDEGFGQGRSSNKAAYTSPDRGLAAISRK